MRIIPLFKHAVYERNACLIWLNKLILTIFWFLMLNSDSKCKVNCELLSGLPLNDQKINLFSESTEVTSWTNGIVCCIGEPFRFYFVCALFAYEILRTVFSSQRCWLEFCFTYIKAILQALIW